MQDLRTVLSSDALNKLRDGYDASAMRTAMLTATVEPYPPLARWNEAIADTFYGDESPLAPIDRERCIIALLAHNGAQFSLAVHLYWGLMEGLSVNELCHIIGLAACYAGIPSVGNSYPVLAKVLTTMSRISETSRYGSLDVVERLVAELVTKA